MKIKIIRNIIIGLALLLAAGEIGYWVGRREAQNLNSGLKFLGGQTLINKSQPASKSQVDFSLFWEVWDRLEKTYLEKSEIKPDQMVYGAIMGMTAALKDPYTVFLPPKENQSSMEELNGFFEGVGIQLGYNKDNQLSVVAPLNGMPAEKAGIKAGDIILHIKDKDKNIDRDTLGLSLPEAVTLIRGPKGTIVTLTVLHENSNQPEEIEIKREEIVLPSVELKFGYLDAEGRWKELKDNQSEDKIIVWLKLSRFGDLTKQQWQKAVNKIIASCGATQVLCRNCNQQEGKTTCKGVILDLRNNPGGYLESSVELAGEFLEQNKLVVKQQNADGSVKEYKTNGNGQLTQIPLIVLVNKGSASASEILAGALRDNQRAKIIGEQTFGKGTVQEAINLRDGSGLHVTVAKWLLPNGMWLDKEGIKPEIEVKDEKPDDDRDVQLEKAAELLIK